MKFEGLEKKELFVDRKKHTFFIKERKGTDCLAINSSTIYVNSEQEIVDIFPGRFWYLDGYIVTIMDGTDHCSYYDIRTGELLFTEYDKRGRCFGRFENGIVLIYDDYISNYHIVSLKGEIGNCAYLYRIGKNALLVKKKKFDKSWSLYDYNMNLIKENVTMEYDNMSFNEKYIICYRQDEGRKYYCICDYLGNVVSEKFMRIQADNIFDFKKVKVQELTDKNKIRTRTEDFLDLLIR